MNKQLKSMTTGGLKELFYDTLIMREQAELGLREINTELASRRQPTPEDIGYKPQKGSTTKEINEMVDNRPGKNPTDIWGGADGGEGPIKPE